MSSARFTASFRDTIPAEMILNELLHNDTVLVDLPDSSTRAWNPASTHHHLYGPAIVEYTITLDGSVTASPQPRVLGKRGEI